MKSKFRLAAVLIAILLLLAACGGGGGEDVPSEDVDVSEEGRYFRTNNSSEPGSLDPALAQGTHESWILQHAFEGLMTYDQEGNVIPGMAEDFPEISEDGLTYTFKLKDNIKWSNGEPITAEDFVYSWIRVANPETASDYSHQMFYIVGMEEFLTGLDEDGKEVEVTEEDIGLKALDDSTLEVQLKNPTAFFTELTAFFTYYPISKDVDQNDPNWAKNADTHVSNGPFELEKWEHNQKILLKKNNEYYNVDAVTIPGIDFDIIDDDNTAYQKYDGGEYDLITKAPPTVIAEMLDNDNEELQLGSMAGTYYFNLNGDIPPFNNAKVRQAFALSIDRDIITEKIAPGDGISAEGVVPFGFNDESGNDYRDGMENALSFDPEKAKDLLTEGLDEEGMDVSVFEEMNLLYNTSELHRVIAQAVQEMWRNNLGVEIGLENVDFQIKLDREKEGDYEISRGGWIGDYADPLTMLELWYSTGAFNDANYDNPAYDELIDQIQASPDQEFRFAKLKEAEDIIMTDMPVVPVYFYAMPYLQKTNIDGVYKTLLEYPHLTFANINE